jgi:hypothetical protein
MFSLSQHLYLVSQYTLPLPERGGPPKKLYRVKPEGARH